MAVCKEWLVQQGALSLPRSLPTSLFPAPVIVVHSLCRATAGDAQGPWPWHQSLDLRGCKPWFDCIAAASSAWAMCPPECLTL